MLPNPILRKNNGAVSWTPWAWFIGTIVLASAVLFDRLGALPIEVWDEARLANNALEMAKSGLSMITTLRWNTGPLEHQTTSPYLADVNINPCIRIE